MTVHSLESNALLSRREAMRIGLASAALLVLSGCQVFRGGKRDGSETAVDQAIDELQRTLESMAADDAESVRLSSIAQRIGKLAREIVAEQVESLDRFDKLSSSREISSEELRADFVGYRARRNAVLDDLLSLQDELRAELTAEEWEDVAEVLNQKADIFESEP